MQAVILCGGLGTRLREETVFIPKPMVEVGERPILWHIMKLYAHFGITDFVLALGYKSDVIKQYFYHYDYMNADVTLDLGAKADMVIHNKHEEANWQVTLANTGQTTMKGARLMRVAKYIEGDTFMLTYGDGVAAIDVAELLAFHKSHGRLATVTGVNPLARFGELRLDGEKVSAFAEKPVKSDDFVNGGFFVFNRGIFEYLTDDEDCDLETDALEKVAENGELMVFRQTGFWACMDTQRDQDYLNKLWREDQAPWKVW